MTEVERWCRGAGLRGRELERGRLKEGTYDEGKEGGEST
jgi:hypothetical protein